MGGKRALAGKYIYLFIACLTLFTLLSCNALKEAKKGEVKQEEMRLKAISEHMILAKELIEQGNFEASVKENQNVLSLSPDGPPADEALFNMGLIYAHSGNPKKDYKKSIFFFQKLLKEYPKSPFVLQAKILIGLLQTIEESKQVDIKLEEMKKEMSK